MHSVFHITHGQLSFRDCKEKKGKTYPISHANLAHIIQAHILPSTKYHLINFPCAWKHEFIGNNLARCKPWLSVLRNYSSLFSAKVLITLPDLVRCQERNFLDKKKFSDKTNCTAFTNPANRMKTPHESFHLFLPSSLVWKILLYFVIRSNKSKRKVSGFIDFVDDSHLEAYNLTHS